MAKIGVVEEFGSKQTTIGARKQPERQSPAKSPETAASWLSRLFLCWLWPLMRLGNGLGLQNVQNALGPANGPKELRAKWQNSTGAESKKRGKAGPDGQPERPVPIKLVPLLWPLFKWPILRAGLARLASDLLLGLGPILLGQVIVFIERKHEDPLSRAPFALFGLLPLSTLGYGCSLALLLFLVFFLRSLLQNQHALWMVKAGIKLQSMLTTALFAKAMDLSTACRSGADSGKWGSGNFINTMSTDVDRLADFAIQLHTLWSMPLQVVITVALLYHYIGLAAIAALAVFLLIFPLNALVLRLNIGWQRAQQQSKTKRLQLLKEVLAGIISLKLYGWEQPLYSAIDQVRAVEVRNIRHSNLLRTLTESYQTMALHLGLLSTFLLFRLLDPAHNLLTPKVAFVAYTLIGLVRPPLFQFAQVMQKFAQVRESRDRVETLLNGEEFRKYSKQPNPSADACKVASEEGILAHCCEEEGQDLAPSPVSICTANCKLSIKKGQLVAVVGQHGSGKSALLAALMGELPARPFPLCVHANVPGGLSYCAQHPFLVQGTVRENILHFCGTDPPVGLDERLLEAVMDACELSGDRGISLDSAVAARGMNLSGGQKARVALARALLRHSQLNLLDDPLAPLDPTVQRAVFDKAIGGPQAMLAGTTRILVTQNVEFIGQCDWLVQMENNSIHWQGPPAEYIRLHGLQAVQQQMDQDENGQQHKESSNGINANKQQQKLPNHQEKKQELAATPVKKSGKSSEVGAVSWTVYLRYLNAMGCHWAIPFILLLVLNNTVALVNTYWLGEWVADVGKKPTVFQGRVEWFQFGVFGSLVLAGLLTIGLACLCQLMGAAVASLGLHRRSVHQLLHAPLQFFNCTENGKILNRLGDDFAQIDLELSHSLRLFITGALLLLQILVTVAVSTSLLFLAFIVPTLLLYFYILRTFIRASNRLKRMERESRSPLYAAFEEAIDGRPSLRAYGVQHRFEAVHDGRLQQYLEVKYLQLASQRWLSTWLELIGSVTILAVALLTVLGASRVLEFGEQWLMPSFVGLSRSLGLAMVLAMLVQQYSLIEAGMVSAERIFQSLKGAGNEMPRKAADAHRQSQEPGMKWPYRGAIDLDGLTASYETGPESREVLRQVTLHIDPSDKVAIVGRTGSGKSSLALALFRILEPRQGRILIDGVDIGQLDVDLLRSRLTVIPQDSLILSQTVRFNLDPFGLYKDADLWYALDRAGLKGFIGGRQEGLSHILTDDSQEMSAGQCQLLLLARALLKGGRILVLDEVGAALDSATEKLVQKVVKEEFSTATVLAITHRTETLGQDYNRVFAMNEGQLEEITNVEGEKK